MYRGANLTTNKSGRGDYGAGVRGELKKIRGKDQSRGRSVGGERSESEEEKVRSSWER